MLDAGKTTAVDALRNPYLSERHGNDAQWRWIIGEDYSALRSSQGNTSPKFRVPMKQYVFDGFLDANPIESRNFIVAGSLARGGLSNAWGCGVAKLSTEELSKYPFDESDIDPSYKAVTERIGVSGAVDDELSGYFGLDDWSQPPVPMNALHARLATRYLASKRRGHVMDDFRLGHIRIAALSTGMGERSACDLSGNCLYGCHNRSLYTAAYEIPRLMAYPNFTYLSGVIVTRVDSRKAGAVVEGDYGTESTIFNADRVLLAMGTLATTRMALRALQLEYPVRVMTSPMATFLLWLPDMIGTKRTGSFGLGQLSFTLKLRGGMNVFGSTFPTTGIPVSEFVRFLPFSRRYGVDLLSTLLSSCLVGNLFLPGELSESTASLGKDGTLLIQGKHSPSVPDLTTEAVKRLRRCFWKSGALLLPRRIVASVPGSDVHYASTLPMRVSPIKGQSDTNGELAGLSHVHVVDGACLSTLTEKPHTLTIMANADRIGRNVADILSA